MINYIWEICIDDYVKKELKENDLSLTQSYVLKERFKELASDIRKNVLPMKTSIQKIKLLIQKEEELNFILFCFGYNFEFLPSDFNRLLESESEEVYLKSNEFLSYDFESKLIINQI